MPSTRPTYTLAHGGEILLCVDAAITPPFVIGEDVELHDEQSHEVMGVFLVEKISRALSFRTLAGGERVPLAGQEVTVHLRKRDSVTRKDGEYAPN